MKTKQSKNKFLFSNFADWWEIEGSGILPEPGADHEEHAKRISALAWTKCLLAQEECAKEILLHAQENDQQALAIRAKHLLLEIRRKITFSS